MESTKTPGFFICDGKYEVLPFSEHTLLLIKKGNYMRMCPRIFQASKSEIESKLNTNIEKFIDGGIFFTKENRRFIAYNCMHPQSP